jgi:CheY-like chemotaxis protein
LPLPSILLVEDDPTQLELLNLLLRHLPNPIYNASGGGEALAVLQNEIPAVIVLDIAMPGVTGLDILHAVREDPRFNTTKVIIVTAGPERLTSEQARLAERLIRKPYSAAALRQAVSDLLAPIR